jgi:hypothetical protein
MLGWRSSRHLLFDPLQSPLKQVFTSLDVPAAIAGSCFFVACRVKSELRLFEFIGCFLGMKLTLFSSAHSCLGMWIV